LAQAFRLIEASCPLPPAIATTAPENAAMGQACGGGNNHGIEDTFYVAETGFQIPVRTVIKMGWKPDHPDFRDRVLNLGPEKVKDLPASKDLRPSEHFPLYDQGNLGSCTANAIGAAFHFDQVKQGIHDFTPSRLFLYYNERRMEMTPGEADADNGAYIRDGIKSVVKIGMCKEPLWPYIESTFKDKPTKECYEQAAKNRGLEYARVPQQLEGMKACINEGFPFVFGFTVYSSFFSNATKVSGNVTMPQETDTVAGGHAVMAIGYDDAKKVFIVRNSWGDTWGDKGYFYMPYDYITQASLASDIWVIKNIAGTPFPTKSIMEG